MNANVHTLQELVQDRGLITNQVPWFGIENVEEAKAAVSEAMKIPNAVCGITDTKGSAWGLPLTDVRDTVNGTILVIENSDAIGCTFNLVAPSSTSLVAAAKLISGNTDRPYLDVKMPFRWWFEVANNKARTNLGYQPKYDFPDMVESALAFRSGKDIGVLPV